VRSLRKNGRLGDPALPSLSSNSFHVKHFHPKFLNSPLPKPCDTPHLSKKHFLWFWTHADTPIRRYLFATPKDHVS
jgi:hypothetical protein